MKKLSQLLMFTALVALFCLVSVNGQTATLTITDDAGKQITVGETEFAKLARQTVKAGDHGKEATFEGVSLTDVLKLAGLEFGEKMRGKELAKFLLVKAADNYQVVFAMAELDPGFTDRVIILADKRDGQPLAANEGKWRMVVPGEKRQGRWVRQVIGLTIISAYKESK